MGRQQGGLVCSWRLWLLVIGFVWLWLVLAGFRRLWQVLAGFDKLVADFFIPFCP